MAQAATHNGWLPIVLDLYADRDTQQLASVCARLDSLSITHLKPALENLLAQYSITAVIYGSGLESCPASLTFLSTRLPIYGNEPAVFTQVNNKIEFFRLLQQLAIPYPKTVFSEPKVGENWLIKPLLGQGGSDISYHQASSNPHHCYWQQYLAGEACSVLFLANTRTAQIIGFNTQWTTTESARPFQFAGIINYCALDDAQRAQLQNWIQQLVVALGLKGLNTLDFIFNKTGCWVLEINPRPSASMQLYTQDLLQQHIQACLGSLPSTINPASVTAYQVLYADEQIKIPKNFTWPILCVDLPENDAIIPCGQPICSVIVNADTSNTVREQLKNLQQIILTKLRKGN